VCVKEKSGDGKRKLKKTLHYEDHSFIPNQAGMGVKVEADNCRKRAGDDVSVRLYIQFVGKNCQTCTRKGMTW